MSDKDYDEYDDCEDPIGDLILMAVGVVFGLVIGVLLGALLW